MSPTRREVWLGGAHLAVLWALGFAQPLFEILSESPEFFVARGNGRWDVVALAIGLVVVPPALMLGAEALGRLVRPALGYALHLVFIALLAAAIALQVLDSATELPAGILVALALLVGAGGAAAYAGTRFVPTVLSVLTPAPVLFVVLFLFFSPVKGIVLPHGDTDALDVEVDSRAPVVVLVFDEFPSISLLDDRDRIDARRFPNFARLARGATWYRNATTVSDFTSRAVPSILSGGDPGPDMLPTAQAEPDNVFTLLGGTYALDVHEDTTRLCPPELCSPDAVESFPERMESLASDLSVVSAHVLLPDAYRSGIPPVDQTFGDFAAGDLDAPSQLEAELNPALEGGRPAGRTAEVRDFIAGIGREPATLHFLHVQLPHLPWQYLQDGKGYPSGDPALQVFAGEHGQWTSQRWLVEHGWQRHLLQVGYADRLVGELVQHLRKIGVYDRALLVVAADHGIAFVPGVERREVQPSTVDQLAGVPLFVKQPRQSDGNVDDRPAQTIDVLPTIADVLGIEVPFDVEGASLAAPAHGADAQAQVSVADRSGGEESLSLDDYLERRADVVAQKVALFGTGSWAGVYEFGAHSELIGSEVPKPAADVPAFELADRELYEDVDTGAFALPALVRGEIEGGVGPDEPIAVAVNGRVAAIGRTYEIAGMTLVSVIVPPSAFRDGPNEVDVARIVVGGGGPVRLETLAAAG